MSLQTIARASNVSAEEQLLARYEADLKTVSIHDGPLIPEGDLLPLRSALMRQMQPATPKQRAGFLALISSAWPYAHQRTDETTLDGFVQQLEEDIAKFPEHILIEVARELRRKQRFAPSISEIYEAADNRWYGLKNKLRALDKHQKEHAQRAAMEQKRAEREAAHRRKTQGWIDRYTALCGVNFAGCSIDDFDLASSAMLAAGMSTLSRWMDAVDNGEPWVAAALPLAAIAGRVFALLKSNALTEAEASQLLPMLTRDRDRGADLIAAIEGDRAPDGWAIKDETAIWEHPSRVFNDLIHDLQRQPGDAISVARHQPHKT